MKFTQGVILGAGRSGTKMLRDALSALPGAGTWPCDEINYVWRHGNATFDTDELEPFHATPRVRRYIRGRFERLARRNGLSCVVEKTCANSLRVGFVHEVLPEAKLIFIVRDGRDVVASAMERWRAPLDLPYVLRKARFVPPTDMPYYALRYLRNRLHRLGSKDKRLSFWGPRFDGMAELGRVSDLATVCAHQWVRCVERTKRGLRAVPGERVLRVRYEDFVHGPSAFLRELADLLEIRAGEDELASCVRHVSSASVGRWRSRLTDREQRTIEPILAETLARYGYEPS